MQNDSDYEVIANSLYEKVLPNIHKINPKDFIECMSFFGKSGLNFDKYLKLVDLYFKSISSCEQKLVLEPLLYEHFLKQYQSEHHFNEFFSVMQKSYPIKTKKVSRTASKKSIWFFNPTPVFLAHTNALFNLLESRETLDLEVNLTSFQYSQKYHERCTSLGVNFVALEGETHEEKFRHLGKMSSDSLAVVWNGPPVHLSYISTILDNVVYWTHRFHPRFENVGSCITGKPGNEPTFCIFEREWQIFSGSFTIKNFGKNSNWSRRKHNFGSFCREELIDNAAHWKNVSALLAHNDKLIYHYAGRKKIHEKWSDKFNIDSSRIKFLGWLQEPEEVIRNMAFVLDGYILGQGLMGMEAIAARVPVVAPAKTEGFYNNFIKNTNFTTVERSILDKLYWAQFKDVTELLVLSGALLNKSTNFEIGTLLGDKLLEREVGSRDFKEFVRLLHVDGFSAS